MLQLIVAVDLVLLLVGLCDDADEIYDIVGDGTFGDNVNDGAIGGRGGLGVKDSSCSFVCCRVCCEFEFEVDDDAANYQNHYCCCVLLLLDDGDVDVVVDIAIDESTIPF